METYLPEIVYGGIDGLITTFAIVAESSGGSLSRNVILTLGFSNVLSDAYSMAIGRYESFDAENIKAEKSAERSALITLFSFILFGLLPLLPFLFYKGDEARRLSLILACIGFLFIGSMKGKVLKQHVVINAGKTLLLGLSAAGLSYYVGSQVSNV